jgi:putative transcriptional regulator
MSRAFDKIAEALKEAIAIFRGEKRPAKLFIPPEIDIRAIRAELDDMKSKEGRRD